jgi:hypothetical protein
VGKRFSSSVGSSSCNGRLWHGKLTRSIESCDGVELLVKVLHDGAVGVRFEPIECDALYPINSPFLSVNRREILTRFCMFQVCDRYSRRWHVRTIYQRSYSRSQPCDGARKVCSGAQYSRTFRTNETHRHSSSHTVFLPAVYSLNGTHRRNRVDGVEGEMAALCIEVTHASGMETAAEDIPTRHHSQRFFHCAIFQSGLDVRESDVQSADIMARGGGREGRWRGVRSFNFP